MNVNKEEELSCASSSPSPALNENACAEAEKMKKLECPFTWDGMYDYVIKINDDMGNTHRNGSDNDDRNDGDDDSSPKLLSSMINYIIRMYRKIVQKYETDEIFEHFKKCDEKLMDLKKIQNESESHVSIQVVEHILQSTKYFAYEKLQMHSEMKQIIDKIQVVDYFNKKDNSTLLGCKAISWSFYHRMSQYESEKYIREAIQENPNYHLWYFQLAKVLRNKRRDSSVGCTPSEEEFDAFFKAYEMSKSEYYEIYIAQLYRENKDDEKALEWYDKVFNRTIKLDPKLHSTKLLRLALGYTQLCAFEKARICLDKVASVCPEKSMYLNYSGKYYMKIKQYDEALEYFKKAMDQHDLAAERQYLLCKLKTDKKFDVTSFLLDMLEKYKNFAQHQHQTIILDLAFSYWLLEDDIHKALDYFYQAAEINPDAECMKYYSIRYFGHVKMQNGNVFQILHKEFLPIIKKVSTKFSEEEIEKADKLQQQYDSFKNRSLLQAQAGIHYRHRNQKSSFFPLNHK